MIKTVTLSGITTVDLDPDRNNPTFYLSEIFTFVKNKTGSTVYVSADPSCVPYADGTVEIPSGASYRFNTPAGNIIYIFGDGDIELTTSKFADNPYQATGSGSGGGTDDYTSLSNKPKINGVTLVGDKSFENLGLEWVKPPVIAGVFDPAATYSENAFVMYNSELYKCTSEHSGAWNSADFSKVTVMECVKSGGGSVNIVENPTAEEIAASITEIWG